MKKCYQFKDQNIFEHGISVWEYFTDLYYHLKFNTPLTFEWNLPSWVYDNKKLLLDALYSLDVIQEYCIFHDIGKSECVEIDSNGNKHFPNHAQVSYETYKKYFSNETVANLIRMDMDVHTLKDIGIDEFIKRKECITLLLVGLSEIHSNSAMFGGISSTNFKIKWKQLNKRGKKICEKLNIIK